ncbi:hypothetical protein HN937_00040, partial [Candidatus Poribacteria bacterium]|nr:hypothetical protein [Candidatus Poribacteria bacterium]
LDEHQHALDTAYKGDSEIEIWSGWLTAVDFTDSHIVLTCKGLAQGVLEREIGRDKIAAFVGGDRYTTASCGSGLTITKLSVSWNGNAWVYLGPLRVTSTGAQTSASLTGRQTVRDIIGAVGATIETAINAQIVTWVGTDVLKVDGFWAAGPSEEGPLQRIGLRFWMSTRTSDVEIGFIDASSVFRAIGLTDETLGPITVRGTSLPDAHRITWTKPHTMTLRPTETAIACYPDPEESQTFPTSGYAKIEYEDNSEIIHYRTKSILSVIQGTFELGNVARGLFDTEALSLDFPPGTTGEGPKIKSLFGWEDEPLPDVLRQMLTGTGAAVYGAYDTVPEYAGIAVDPAAVDADSFDAFNDEPFIKRSIAPEKPLKFKKFVGKNGVFHGYIFGGRTGADGRFRLGVLPVPVATVAAAGLVLTDQHDGGLIRVLPHIRQAKTVINRVEVRADFDPVTGKYRGEPVRLKYASGRTRLPNGETAEVEAPGLSTTAVQTAAEYVAERIFGVWGDPRAIVSLEIDRRALLASAGQLLRVTAAAVTGPHGSRGLTAQPCVISTLEKAWFRPGNAAAVEADALVFGEFGGLAPTFDVSVSGTTCTVSANVFTQPSDAIPWDGYTECRDWMYGPASGETFKLVFWAKGAYASRVEQTAAWASDGTWTLGGVLGITPDYAEFAPWGAASRHADQDDFVHIADSSNQLGGADSDFVWSP